MNSDLSDTEPVGVDIGSHEAAHRACEADERRALITKLHGGSLEAAFDAFAKERDAYRIRALAAEKALSELRRSVTTIFDQWQREGRTR